MRKISLIIMAVLSISVYAATEFEDEDRSTWTDKEMIEKLCGSCHSMNGYFTSDRSLKSWALTIERMRDFAVGTETEYTEEEGTRMAKYLASNPAEMKEFEYTDYYASNDEKTKGTNEAESRPVRTKIVYVTAGHRAPPGFRGPSRATAAAKHTGYLAVVALVVLLLTGLIRKKIGRAIFKPLHNASALLLFVCVSIHGIIYLAEYGAPGVLWLWFGIIGLLILVVAESVGIFRRQLPKIFIPIHAIGGLIGLILTILHWVWIYI